MRLYLIIVEEPFFHPEFVREMIKEKRDEIVGISVVPNIPQRTTLLAYLRKEYTLLGPYAFWVLGFKASCYRFLDFLDRFFVFPKNFSVLQTAKKSGCPLFLTNDVNSHEHLVYLSKKSPDLIISACGQYFNKTLLNIPRLGCINRHSSLLPKYKGLLPVFWAMLNNEGKIGVSVSKMISKIDSGEIIAQEAIEVSFFDSLYSLYAKAFRLSPQVVLQAIDRLQGVNRKRIPYDLAEASYFSFPDRDSIRKFRKSGKRIL